MNPVLGLILPLWILLVRRFHEASDLTDSDDVVVNILLALVATESTSTYFALTSKVRCAKKLKLIFFIMWLSAISLFNNFAFLSTVTLLPFMRLEKVFDSVICSTAEVMLILISLVKQYCKDYNMYRHFTYSVSILGNVFIVVYLVCSGIENCVGLFNRSAFIIDIVPHDCLHRPNDDFNSTQLLTNNLSLSRYVMNDKGLIKNVSVYNHTDNDGTVLPYSRVEYHRRIGEEVRMVCGFGLRKPITCFNGPLPNACAMFYWKRDGQIVNSTNARIQITQNLTWINRTMTKYSEYWHVELELIIHEVVNNDFGMYECAMKLYANEHSLTEFFPGRYLLTEEKDCSEVEVLTSYLGSDMNIYFVTGINVSPELFGDINVQYTINGKDFTDQCKGMCFWHHRLFLWFTEGVQSTKSGFLVHSADGTLHVNAYSCCCANMFGLHRLTAQKPFANTSIPVEIFLKEYILLPESTFLKNNSYIRDILKASRINDTTGEFDPEILNLIQQTEWTYFNGMGLFFLIVDLIVSECLVWFLPVITDTYVKWSSSLTGRVVLAVQPTQDHFKYDVLLASSDEDYNLVSTVLMPALENEFGLRVCFPDRDFHQGQQELLAFSNAMQQSSKTLVVLSNDYLADPRFGEAQLMSILFPQLVYKHRQENHFVLTTIKSTPLPAYLLRLTTQTIDLSSITPWKLFQLRRKLMSVREYWIVSLVCYFSRHVLPVRMRLFVMYAIQRIKRVVAEMG